MVDKWSTNGQQIVNGDGVRSSHTTQSGHVICLRSRLIESAPLHRTEFASLHLIDVGEERSIDREMETQLSRASYQAQSWDYSKLPISLNIMPFNVLAFAFAFAFPFAFAFALALIPGLAPELQRGLPVPPDVNRT